MALNINQFALTPVQGQMDLEFAGSVISCQVDNDQATALIAGQAVKLSTDAGGVPKVLGLAANTDASFGFVARNLKDQNFPTLAAVEIAQFNSCMWMTAGAAITRGASLEVVYTTNKVITNAGTNPVVGYALDTALANGDLIRVVIQAPYAAVNSNLTGRVQQAIVTATLAEINAGKVLIPGVTGQKITILDYIARVNGASFAGGTNIILESTAGSPVVVSTIAEAGLVSGAVLVPSSANTTLGAGFGAQLGTADGFQVVSTGTHTTTTGITFTLTFTQQ